MKIRILTSCTGEKLHTPETQLTQDDFQLLHQPKQFAAREKALAQYRTPAQDLYTGQQHVRLMQGIQHAQGEAGTLEIELWILSAGYGLIPGEREIVPYECTFQGMKNAEIRQWADHLQIPAAAAQLLAEPADLNLVLLGDGYLKALGLTADVRFAAPTLFLTSAGAQKQIQGTGQLIKLPLSNQEAKRFSCGLVGLKGELAKRILQRLKDDAATFRALLLDPASDLLSLLEAESAARPAQRTGARANPRVDQVIQIPASWWQKPHREKLRYFIPEWDDLVDPDYDFASDTHAGGQGDWSNETYAHQMYPEPNYDGILISKVVAEKSKNKKARINQLGVHRFLRVPREFPIMGDCGAFGYIMQETPPYTTDEILDYYTRLDFDYGVSLDHLIVKATEEQKKFRYDLTIHNAEAFLREHRKRGLTWEPIGAVQGWDAASYTEAARQYVAMGYKYIALGGLVRTNTNEILRVLETVHEVVPEHVQIHLFGLARIRALAEFAKLGVRSVDSASFLRRAWMGTGQNYFSMEGELYAAIRIPEGGKSFRAKRMVSEGRAEAALTEKLEKQCLDAMMKFDAGQISVDKALAVIQEYDHLITPDRPDNSALLRKTLEAAPWKSCPCEICQKDGIQVIIFRGNNRNRRRGFHNTFIFYRLIQRILAGEKVTMPGMKEEDESEPSSQLSLFPRAEAAAR